MPFKYNVYTSKLDFYEDTTLPPVPEVQVFFSTNLPTDVGVEFTPDTPALENTLYISETTSQVYTYAAGIYSSYVSPIPNNTPFYIYGSSLDAGGNKTAVLSRNGAVAATSFNTKKNLTNTGPSNHNKWWKVFDYNIYSNYIGDSFKLQMNEYNTSSGAGKSVIFNIIVKRQDPNVYVTVDIESGATAFDLTNFDVLYNSTTKRLSFFYKLTTTYTYTSWLVLNAKASTTSEIVWYNTLIGTTLSGQTSNALASKVVSLNKVNGAYSLPTIAPTVDQVLGYSSPGNSDWITLNIATATGNTLYVSKSGSDTDTTRIGHIGNIMKPFLTIEAAVTAAVPGDTIYVFYGTYAITTTATNGIAKDGVIFRFEDSTSLTKTSIGDVFNDTGFTVGCNIYGKVNITKTTGAGHIIYFAQNLNYTIEYGYLVNSAVGTCISLKYTGAGTNIVSIKGISAVASAGICYDVQNVGFFNIDFGVLMKSTSTYAWQSRIVNGAGVWDINKGMLKGEQLITTAAVYSANIAYTQMNVDITYSNYVYTDGTMQVNWNGSVIDRLSAGSFKHSGIVTRYDGGGDGVFLDRVGYFIANQTGYCSINYLTGATSLYNNTLSGGGTLVIYNQKDSIPNWLNITTSSTLIIKSKYVTTTYNASGGSLAITNGRVVFENGFTYPNGQPAITMSGTAIVELINGTCENTGNTVSGNVVDHRGGTLILRNATLKTANADAEVVVAPTTAVSIYIQPTLLSNRVENGGVLVAKKQKHMLSVGGVQAQSVTLNDGSGANEIFTISDIVTYNTTAKQAQQFAALINASATLDITATQDTPGTDVYFYLEADVAGVPFTYIAGANTISNPGTVLRKNNYAINNIVGGSIIEDADVK